MRQEKNERERERKRDREREKGLYWLNKKNVGINVGEEIL